MVSLRELSDNEYFVKIYVVPLESEVSPQEMSNVFGLIEYVGSGSTLNELVVYRFLGIEKEHLNCNSTILISTKLKPEPENIDCNNQNVLSISVPFTDAIPYADVTYGNSLLKDFEAVFGSRRHLTIQNNSGMDLWFEWFRDVHEDHAIDFIQNNNHATRKSRKVNTSASFPVKVYKNDAGNMGEYLGAFSAEVYTHDRVVCVVATINGEQYLQVISIVELPGKILLSILIG